MSDEDEKREWIEEHGSRRLRRCLAEGIECQAIYRDERIALELPGWEYGAVLGAQEARNPPEEALDLLDAARAKLDQGRRQEARLAFSRGTYYVTGPVVLGETTRWKKTAGQVQRGAERGTLNLCERCGGNGQVDGCRACGAPARRDAKRGQ